MTQFELILTGYSIIIALCVARLLDGLHASFRLERLYWVHCLWVVNKLMNTALYFWGIWVYREVGSWTVLDYLVIIAAPGVVYLQCNALVTTSPETAERWRDHYYEIHRWFFAVNLLLCPIGLLAIHVVAKASFPAPVTYSFALVFVLSILGAVSRSPRIHGLIAVTSFFNLTLGFAGQFMRDSNQLMAG